MTQAEICNLALSRLGIRRYITAITDSSVEAQACDLHWQPTLERLLSRADWKYARKRAALASTGTPPVEWGYSFAMPTDYVKDLHIVDGLRVRDARKRIKYDMETDGTDRLIYCDEEEPTFVYIADLGDPTKYPAVFASALGWALALELLEPLVNDSKRQQRIEMKAHREITSAIASTFNEGEPENEPVSEFQSYRH